MNKIKLLYNSIKGLLSKEVQVAMLREANSTLVIHRSVEVKSISRLVLGKNCIIQENVIINCGGEWSGNRGYMKSGDNLFLGSGVILYAAGGLEIGNNVGIGSLSCIVTHNHRFENAGTKAYMSNDSDYGRVVIEDNVIINMGCVIGKGVTIGENSVVGANSTVLKDVPRNVLVAGCPARIIREI